MLAQQPPSNNPFLANTTWTAVQQQILRSVSSSERTARLVYVTYDDGIEAWTISDKEIKAHWIAVRKHDLEKLAKKFSELCSTGSSSLEEVHSLGQRLYTILIAPVIQDLPPRALAIELDRTLQSLPIEA